MKGGLEAFEEKGGSLEDQNKELKLMLQRLLDSEKKKDLRIQKLEAAQHEHSHAGHAHDLPAGGDPTQFYTEMCILLFGLSFHSFFVGLALGINSNDLALLIAIIAHQFFEGLGLGFRIAKAALPKSWQSIILELCFAISAPVGMAAGIGIQNALQSGSTTLLIVQGVAAAFSAGILIMVGLVHMLQEEMTKPEVIARPALQNAMICGLIVGATILTIIAIWA